MTLQSPSEAMGTFLPVHSLGRSSHRSDVRRPADHEPDDRRRGRVVERRGRRDGRLLERGVRARGVRPLTWRSTACAGGSSWPTGARRNGPRAIASCAAARSPACATSRRRAPPTSCPRSSCRRRPATTPASSTTAPGRARCRRSSRPGSSASTRWTGSASRRRPRTRRSPTTWPRSTPPCRGRRRRAPSTSWATARAAGWPPSTRRCTPSASTRSPSPARRSTSTPGAPSSTRACRRSATTTCPSSALSSPRATACSRASSWSAASSSSSPRTRSASSCSCWPTSATPRHVERYRAFEDWFKHTQDIAGPFYLWLVEHLFRDNELIGGTLRIGDEAVDLGRIDCPVNLLAGAADHITPPEQVFALADAVATPAARITRRTTSGGHLGLFMGTEALRDHWPVVMASVLEHSRPARTPPRPAGAPARAPPSAGPSRRPSRSGLSGWRERGAGRACATNAR